MLLLLIDVIVTSLPSDLSFVVSGILYLSPPPLFLFSPHELILDPS